jgi:hypothetical protein
MCMKQKKERGKSIKSKRERVCDSSMSLCTKLGRKERDTDTERESRKREREIRKRERDQKERECLSV